MPTILALDCGSATTTAALIDNITGAYRIEAIGRAPTAMPITQGIQTAIRTLEAVSGYTLLNRDGQPILSRTGEKRGLDIVVVVSSAGPPLRVLLAGLIPELSLASTHRAAATIYTEPATILSINDETHETRLSLIKEAKPEVILLAGGIDGGATGPLLELTQSIAMALALLPEEERPSLLYAGNLDTRPQIAEILGAWVGLNVVDNVRPTLEVENLAAAQIEIEKLYLQRKLNHLPGVREIAGWSQAPVMPACKSFEKTIAYLGKRHNWNVLGANLGSRSTVVAIGNPTHYSATVRSDAGLGHSLPALLKSVPLEAIHRWLPFELSPAELQNHLLNKTLFPHSIPTTAEELLIELAVAREALRRVMQEARAGWPLQPKIGLRDIQWNLILGAGAVLGLAPQPAYAALALLDGLEPWGVSRLALDTTGIANMLGQLATVEAEAAVQVAARPDTFLDLGTVIAPVGYRRAGKPALKKLRLIHTGGATEEWEVPSGSLQVIPLPPGQIATLEIHPTYHFDIGLGQPGRSAVTEVRGGLLGLIVDARGRPLRLPPDEADRRAQLQQWHQDIRP
jgi:hypothetical protein